MSTLRNSIIKQILDSLLNGEFQLEDFECNFPDGERTLATITFKAYPNYEFLIIEDYIGNNLVKAMANIQGGGKKSLKTVEKPGEFKNHEETVHENIDDCISRVHYWVQNIRQDLVDLQHVSKTTIDEVIVNFQKQIDDSIENPEEYFDDDEKQKIINKLNTLQERVDDLEKKFDIPEEKSKKIAKAIEKSKSDIEIYPKGIWYKTAGNKIISSLKHALGTKEGREVLLEITKKLLS